MRQFACGVHRGCERAHLVVIPEAASERLAHHVMAMPLGRKSPNEEGSDEEDAETGHPTTPGAWQLPSRRILTNTGMWDCWNRTGPMPSMFRFTCGRHQTHARIERPTISPSGYPKAPRMETASSVQFRRLRAKMSSNLPRICPESAQNMPKEAKVED